MIDLVDRAIGFAARAHQGQQRKTGDVPYIAHPVAVAMILQRMDCAETIVAAGLLHDVVEDTSVTLKDVRRHFGDEVAEIVAGCTELPKNRNRWETRKLFMIGKQAMNTRIEAYGNVVKPVLAPDWSLSWTLQFLFPK